MQIKIIYFYYLLFCTIACGSPIGQEDDSVIRKDTIEQQTDPDPLKGVEEQDNVQNTELQIWKWSEMNLPPHPWSDETEFGDDFFVDSAYDPSSVSLLGKKIRFFLNPVKPANDDPNVFNYRAEIHTAPWPIEHPLKTEQWLGWEYTFGEYYRIDKTSPITIFQNHPGVNGLSPQIELEIAAFNTPSPAEGGEIQIINEANEERIVTNIKPSAGDSLQVVIHIVFGIEDEGLLTIWLNGEKYYDKNVSTVYGDYPWGGNNKWGIYHHTFNGSSTDVFSTLEMGIESVELLMGPLRTWTRSPDHPLYRQDAYELVRPEN
jgi:hypothetical protein